MHAPDPNEQSALSHFNLSTWALKNQALVLYFILLTLVGGFFAYTHLGQSEDPPFTFKVMLIRSSWPGASAQEVEQQITDKIEKKLQEIPSIDYTSSYSRPGESVVFIVIRDNTFSEKNSRVMVSSTQKKLVIFGIPSPAICRASPLTMNLVMCMAACMPSLQMA